MLALADEQGRIVLTAQDSVEGLLLREPHGSNGFGYDPLFFFPDLGKTTAEVDPKEKHTISDAEVFSNSVGMSKPDPHTSSTTTIPSWCQAPLHRSVQPGVSKGR